MVELLELLCQQIDKEDQFCRIFKKMLKSIAWNISWQFWSMKKENPVKKKKKKLKLIRK